MSLSNIVDSQSLEDKYLAMHRYKNTQCYLTEWETKNSAVPFTSEENVRGTPWFVANVQITECKALVGS